MPPSAPAESAAPAAPPPPAAEEIITAPGGLPAPVEMPAASPAVQQPDPASNGFNFMDEQEVGELTVKEEEACVYNSRLHILNPVHEQMRVLACFVFTVGGLKLFFPHGVLGCILCKLNLFLRKHQNRRNF
jgi:hypothetical protein